MQWFRVEELILAFKVVNRIYELRNLELVCIATVSDQHKYYCPETTKKKQLTTSSLWCRAVGHEALYYYFKQFQASLGQK